MSDNPLARVMGATKPANKDGDNRGQYAYATTDEVFGVVREALASEGLIIWQTEVGPARFEGQSVVMQYALAITDSLRPVPIENCELVTVSAHVKSASVMAALRSYALKYYLRGKFLILVGKNAPDVDAHKPEAGALPKEQPPAPAAAMPAPAKELHWQFTKGIASLYDHNGEVQEPPYSLDALRTLFAWGRAGLTDADAKTRKTTAAILAANEDLLGQIPEKGREAIKALVAKVDAEKPEGAA